MWVLFFIDAAVIILHFLLKQKLGFFDLDKEGNLASLYSGFKLWFAATIIFLYAWLQHVRGRARRDVFVWGALGAGILYIGLDDMMALHERCGFVLNNIFGTGGFHGESFNWLFYFSPFIVAALVIFARAIFILWNEARGSAVWLCVGIALWCASIISEFIGRKMILSVNINVPVYHSLIVIEEGLEMFGATCITIAFILLLRAAVKKFVRVEK